MADISANLSAIYEEGFGEKTVLYRVRQADTADTVNVNAKFVEVKAASFIAAGTLATIGTVGISGTVLTLTLATMADDNIFLLVVGQGAA